LAASLQAILPCESRFTDDLEDDVECDGKCLGDPPWDPLPVACALEFELWLDEVAAEPKLAKAQAQKRRKTARLIAFFS
jgi:hypothetical protein